MQKRPDLSLHEYSTETKRNASNDIVTTSGTSTLPKYILH